ncbi:MAG: Phospho-N-acetylmuramoyl-pentapeptide-transferase [Gammaproteobacteria bacterium]|nr:MAG: Phospho-N-acetylmuramoyl-pentapeptide-transferase [Gammaproteobacteria bacterium]|tara:strand:+ start:171 stop:1256 length:1086 start_codon:yes stop_codon:yes gene_type:complete
MLYYLFEYLTQYYSGFDVFRYLTLRIILSALTALTISLIIGPIIINYLISKKLYQSIREDGPKSHIDEKSKTPSMGGVIIIFSIIISSLLWGDIFNEYIWILSFVLLTFGMIGFYDDYQKFINSSSDGISGKTKLIFQIALSGIVAYYIFITSTNPTELSLTMPFLKNFSLYLGILFIPWTILVIIGSSNAVNLTDGLDGLAILPCILIAAAFVLFAYVEGNFNIANYLLIPYLPGVSEIAIFSSAVVGSGLGFLWYNSYPAQVFMGDVGSLSLGAVLATIAVLLRLEIVYALMGGVFVMEALSVMIQVTSYKLFKKRVFRMSPIHHHFELKGWPEPKIIVRFWIITFILVLIALASLKIR